MGTMDQIAAMGDEGEASDAGETEASYGSESTPEPRQKAPSNDGPDDAPDKPEAKAKPKEGERKAVKLKRRGEEREVDLEDRDSVEKLLRELDDDHEDEWNGPGGKPVKLNRQALQRRVELAEGALQSMELTAKERKEVKAELSWAKDNIEDWMESEGGVEDLDSWVLERAEKIWRRQMAGTPQLPNGEQNPDYNPHEYHRMLMERAEQKATRKARVERALGEQRQKAEQQQSERARYDAAHRDAFQKLGTQGNDVLLDLAMKRLGQYQRAGAKTTPQSVAADALEAYDTMLMSRFDALDTAGKLRILGDKRRGVLREAEVEAAKLQKREQKQAAKAEEPATTGNGRAVETMESFMKGLNR